MKTLTPGRQFKSICNLPGRLRWPCYWMAAWVCLLLSPAMVQATVTPLAYWRMGEHDTPMVFFGGALVATNFTDETGHYPLTVYGLVPYYTNVSVTASNTTGSSVCAGFFGTGADATATNVVSTLTNNFGIECFVNSTVPNTEQIIAYNGNASSSGWGLMIHQTNYCGIFGGVAYIGAVPVVTNVWVHLALVRASGTTTFYVNGEPAATTTQAPNVPATEFALGGAPQVNSGYFDGDLDEVRVFKFAPGQFSTNDLLLNNCLPVVTSLPASQVTATNAELNGTVNAVGLPGQYWFSFGTTTNYGLNVGTQAMSPTHATLAVSNLVNGLPGVTYHFAMTADNSTGLVMGADQAFTLSDLLPTVVTLPASAVNGFGATLNASVDPNGGATAAEFEWGTTTNYGNITPVMHFPATNYVFAASSVINLLPFSTYHFRIDASNSQGTVLGNDQTFATPGEPPTVTTLPASNLTTGSAVLNGTVDPNGVPASYWFQVSWGPTNSLPGTNAVLAVSQLVSNLSFPPASPRVFFYALVASNAFGTSTGATIPVYVPGVYHVTCTNDTLDVSSLRGAISLAPSGSVIYLDVAGGTYYLTNGELTIANNLTLIGALPMPIINTLYTSEAFNFGGGAACYLANLTIENGVNPAGGAIYNDGSLVISNCYFVNNLGQPGSAEFLGPGAIQNDGTLLALNCTFMNNYGAAGLEDNSGNGLMGGAGAIDNFGTLVMTNATFYGNAGGAGGSGPPNEPSPVYLPSSGSGGSGAIDNFASLTLVSCTIAGNAGGNAGVPGWYYFGILDGSPLYIYGSWGATGYGGIFSYYYGNQNWSLDNCIVTDPSYGEVGWSDQYVDGGSNQYCLIGGGYISSFGPLDYGYSYYPPVLPLLPNSPEINAGDDSLTGTDERGLPRSQGGGVDVGAYELAPNPPVPTQLAGQLLPGSGYMQLNFSNSLYMDFIVLGTTNITLPLADWIPLGPATEMTPGQYQFIDPGATNFPQRFYQIISP